MSEADTIKEPAPQNAQEDKDCQPRPMKDCGEKMEAAKYQRDAARQSVLNAEGYTTSVANAFNSLEVQIAALLLPLIGLFINAVARPEVSQWYKFIFILAAISIILSLVMGLLHLKREEKFFDDSINQKHHRSLEWNKAVERKITYEQALGYHEGTQLAKGQVVSVPIWTWILQTVFLGIGTGLLFIVFAAYLFSNGNL
jgi:hypothetical protein